VIVATAVIPATTLGMNTAALWIDTAYDPYSVEPKARIAK